MRLDDRLEVLAPHVEAHWREKFLTELSLRGAGWEAISDAMGEVETHCRESAQSAQQAFGSPADYAQALGLPDQVHRKPAQALRTWTRVLLLIGGVWAIFLGGPPFLLGQRAEVNAGMLVSAAATVALMVVVVSLWRRVIRSFIEHRVRFALCFLVVVTVVPLAGVPFDDVVLGSVAAGPTLAVGIIATLASIIWTYLGVRADTNRDDVLAAPRTRTRTRPGTGDRR